MAGQRTVKAIITASASGLISELNKAGAAADKFGNNLSASISKNEASINTLANTAGLLGGALAVGVAAAVKTSADFDQQMSAVAATGKDAKQNIEALRDAAITMGAQTSFSAGEAANGIEELGKAGVSAKDVLGGGLKGALDLAAAGQLGVGEAAEIAATAMTQFKLSGEDVPHIADLLAAGAGKAQGSVQDMGAALKQSGLVAASFGLSIEETTGTLAAFASSGLVGSDAGTSFKTMLQALANPSAKSAKLMKELGINAYDASGNFVGMEGLAAELKDSLAGLTEEQRNATVAQIFGSDAVRSANILYEQGPAGIKKWISEVNDAGFASETAATKMDNLNGDLEGLKGAFETALIGLGEGAQGPLRDLVQNLTNAVDKFNELGDGAKGKILVVTAALAGLLLSIAGIGKLVIGINNVVGAFKALGITGSTLKGKLSSVKDGLSQVDKGAVLAAAAILAVKAAAAALQDDLDKSSAGVEGYSNSLLAVKDGGDQLDSDFAKWGDSAMLLGQGIDSSADAFESLAAVQNPVAEGLDKIGSALGIKGSVTILTEEFGKLDDALVNMKPEDAAEAFKKLSKEAEAAGFTLEDQQELFDDYKKKLQEQATELGVTGLSLEDYAAWMSGKVPESIKKAQEAQEKATGTTKDAKTPVDDLAESNRDLEVATEKLATETQRIIDKFTILKDGALDVGRANDQWSESLEALSEEAADASAAQDTLSEANDRVTDAQKKLTDMRKKGKASSEELKDAERDLEDAKKDQKTASENLTDAHKKNSKSLKGNSEEARNNREKIRQAITAMNDKVTADFKATEQTDGVTAATKEASDSLKKMRTDLINQAEKAGYSREESKKMVDQYLKTPKELRTDIKTPGINEAQDEVDRLQKKIDKMKSKTVNLDFKVLAGGKAVKIGNKIMTPGNLGGGYADGGYTGPGGKYDEAGIVHKGEVVFDQDAVKAAGGPGKLESLRLGLKSGKIRGYAEGGVVGTTLSIPTSMPDVSPALSYMQDSVDAVGDAMVAYLRSQIGGAFPMGSNSKMKTFEGHRFTENFANRLSAIHDIQPFNIFQGGFRPTTSYSGTSHAKDAVDAGPVSDKLVRIMRQYGIAAWDRTGKGNWAPHIHGVPLPGAGVAGGSAVWQAQDYQNGGDGLGGKDNGPKVSLGAVQASFGVAAAGGAGSFNREQRSNASTIMAVANALGFGSRGAKIALMTAMQESTLRNIGYGDRDSVGLFQQRAPWGPRSARMNPAMAARMFFTGGMGGQRGLSSFPWQSMGLAQAAQAVQVSEFPSAYAKWADEADQLLHGKGYANGTNSATGGVHGIAEKGAELVLSPGYRLFKGGEQVLNASETRRAIVDSPRGAYTAGPPSSSSGHVIQPPEVVIQGNVYGDTYARDLARRIQVEKRDAMVMAGL